MKKLCNLAMVAMALAAAPLVTAAPGSFQSSASEKPVMLAQAKKKKAAAKGVREKFITREATLKGKDQKNLDFDAVDIGGQRKTPMGTLINQNKADKNYDFVKIRLRWHPEMVQSASSLDYAN
jgi:hypothetical protein